VSKEYEGMRVNVPRINVCAQLCVCVCECLHAVMCVCMCERERDREGEKSVTALMRECQKFN
jgi:hypothetical protein